MKYKAFSLARGSNQYIDKVKKNNPRARAYFGLVLVSLAISLGLYVLAGDMMRLYVFPFVDRTFRTVAYAPEKLISPLAQHAYAQAKQPTEKEIIYSQKHGDIIWRIYGLESSFGKNDGCRKQGMYNGFGYRQNSNEWICYPTFLSVVEHVENWLEVRDGLPLGQALCLYNQGKTNADCDYVGNFLNL